MATAQQQPVVPAFSRKQIAASLSAVFVGYFVYSYFLQALNVATPRMAADLNGMALYSWSVSIPSLGLIVGTLLSGKLSDIYGRRALIFLSTLVILVAAVLCAISPTFIALIAARALLCLGQGILGPLCFSVVGDIFTGAQRSKWAGMLNISFGVPALLCPSLSGWLVDNLSWRHIFWWAIPLAVVCLIIVYGMPPLVQGAAHKIDVTGAILVTIASSALIFGLSFAGTTYPWASWQVIGLLAAAVVFGGLFLKVESRAEEPLLDPQLLKNRVFMTASAAGFLSFFGMMGMTLYYPLFMQGIQEMSAMKSGQIITPFSVLMGVIGIPTGFLLARTRRYRWIYNLGYAMLVATMIAMVFFDRNTPALLGVVVATLGGIGVGAIPTINTLVIQAAVPRKLLGVATGALFFSVALGMAAAPAILGSAMNIRYNAALKGSLPSSITQVANAATITSLGDPKVLLSQPAMEGLRQTLAGKGEDGQALFIQTVQAIRASMESGLKVVFFIAALTMFAAFVMILTIPSVPLK